MTSSNPATTTPRWRRVASAIFAVLVCAPALWQVGLQIRLWMARKSYPMDIEWLEGSWLYQGYRVFSFQPTYAPPAGGFLPQLHPPAYMTLVGLLGHIFPVSYAMGRTLSLAFFTLASVLVVRELRRKEEEQALHGWTSGLLAIGCAIAAVPLIEGFYDLVRPDVMALGLCVLAGALSDMPKRPKPGRVVFLALVLTAALYTRLSSVFFIVWIVVYVFAKERKTGLLLAVLCAASCGLVLVGLQFTTKGWYWMYTVSWLQEHKILPERVKIGLDIVHKHAPFIAAVPVVFFGLAVTRKVSARTVFWVGMLGAGLMASLLPFCKVGGFSNDFVPFAFLYGVATLFVVSDVARALGKWPRIAFGVRAFSYVGIAAFLFIRRWDVARFAPNPDQWKRADALAAKLRGLEGGVIIPRHPFLPISNGQTNRQWSDMPYLDAVWTGAVSDLKLGPYIDRIHASYAIVSGTEIGYTAGELGARYQVEETIPSPPTTLIGERSTPKYLLRWQDDEKDARVLFDFEQSDWSGWEVVGEAFGPGPTSPRPKWQNVIKGSIGNGLANSYHPERKDSGTGTLTSPTFVIDRDRIGLRVGGGWKRGTRVELLVNGRTQKTASGIFEASESMIRVVWDVRRFKGQEARIALIDQDAGSWGHLLCDNIVLY